ncbi:hypothetical protein [Kribbella sp. VKM Ac-2568]|uniref:hypothetical protein n=1 Tax=Kribbella sp. VKM Ac-2568 TaxID=2512219 RepID=UPI00104FFE7C|nr:hypothetical protein [Kribbella sp. VKM Ac-2568]TCM46949.1 hypothetical protein EV648_105427 [Kribbella sp. VKM Ac-2568]
MPKSTRSKSSWRQGRRGRPTAIMPGAVETITRPNQSTPVVILLSLWRWRWEFTVLAGLVYVWHWHLASIRTFFADTLPAWVAVVFLVGTFYWLVADTPVRRFLRNRMWCVITRHRVRACLVETRMLNYSGNLPFIVGCFSTKTGQVVWLWMRPGLSIEKLENQTETLASACWARSALIARSQRNAALVRIDIDRRDPLANKNITSPLLHDTSGLPEAAVDEDALLPFITPETVPAESTTPPPTKTGTSGETRTKTSKTKTSAAVNDGNIVILGANGEDVSDYV